MKLRQKLAAVLAATMVVTAVPVTTMAATASLAHTITITEGATKSVDLVVTFTDAEKNSTSGSVFYVEAKDAEFPNTQENGYTVAPDAELEEEIDAAIAAINAIDLSELADDEAIGVELATEISNAVDLADALGVNVTAFATVDATTEAQDVPAFTAVLNSLNGLKTNSQGSLAYTIERLGSGVLKVTIIDRSEGFLTMPINVKAKAGEPRLVVDGTNSVVNSTTLSVTGETTVGKDLLKAEFTGLTTLPVDGRGAIGTVRIRESVVGSLEGKTEAQRTITIALPKSSDLKFIATDVTVKGERGFFGYEEDETSVTIVPNSNSKEITITLPEQVSTSLGYFDIKGIQVVAEDTRKSVRTGDVNVTVTGYDTDTLSMIKKTTGKVATIKDYGMSIEVEEVVELVAGKDEETIVVTIKEAAFDSFNERNTIYVSVDNAVITSDIADEIVSDTENVDVEVDADVKDGEIIGYYLTVTRTSDTKAAEIELEFDIRAELDATGEVTVLAESRGFDKDLEVKVADIVTPFTITTETADVEIGLRGQDAGTITIKETEDGMLDRGTIIIELPTNVGMSFVNNKNAIKIETTDTLDVTVSSVSGSTITLNVNRTSREAAELTISGIQVDVNRTSAYGEIEAILSGTALTAHGEIEVPGFINVTTPNVPTAPQSAPVEASFTMASNSFVVNGEVKIMDVAPYVSAEGRTMVPVKYLVDALGLPEEALMFNVIDGVGTVTIIADSKVITLKNGEKSLTVNGAVVPMTSAVTIKDGRTFTPVTEIAAVLGMSATWDAGTQTATFSK